MLEIKFLGPEYPHISNLKTKTAILKFFWKSTCRPSVVIVHRWDFSWPDSCSGGLKVNRGWFERFLLKLIFFGIFCQHPSTALRKHNSYFSLEKHSVLKNPPTLSDVLGHHDKIRTKMRKCGTKNWNVWRECVRFLDPFYEMEKSKSTMQKNVWKFV